MEFPYDYYLVIIFNLFFIYFRLNIIWGIVSLKNNIKKNINGKEIDIDYWDRTVTKRKKKKFMCVSPKSKKKVWVILLF